MAKLYSVGITGWLSNVENKISKYEKVTYKHKSSQTEAKTIFISSSNINTRKNTKIYTKNI